MTECVVDGCLIGKWESEFPRHQKLGQHNDAFCCPACGRLWATQKHSPFWGWFFHNVPCASCKPRWSEEVPGSLETYHGAWIEENAPRAYWLREFHLLNREIKDANATVGQAVLELESTDTEA